MLENITVWSFSLNVGIRKKAVIRSVWCMYIIMKLDKGLIFMGNKKVVRHENTR